MELTLIIDYIIISIIASIAINSFLRNYAKKYNFLIDIPNRSRKFHKRATPLTGGIGILVALFISGKLYIDLNNLNGYLPNFTFHLMIISIPLLGLFLIDDYLKKNEKSYESSKIQNKNNYIGTYLRIFIQSILSIYIILTTDVCNIKKIWN